MSPGVVRHYPNCCPRELQDEPGLWEQHPEHAWAIDETAWPLCCGPKTAEWARQICTCSARRWIKRDQLPAGTRHSTATSSPGPRKVTFPGANPEPAEWTPDLPKATFHTAGRYPANDDGPTKIIPLPPKILPSEVGFAIQDACWCGPEGRRHERYGEFCRLAVANDEEK